MTIASDFDNTLYVKDSIGLEKNINAVRKFLNCGNTFIIITGRSFSNIKKVLTQYNIPYTYLVCQDGANIFDKNDNLIKSNLLDIKKAKSIEAYLLENNISYSFESAFNDFDTIENAVKITVTISKTDDALTMLSNIKHFDVYAYVSTKHINIIDSYVNKGSALEYLLNNNYIKNNIEVIGDDINDYEMLCEYDGVIMKKHDKILDNLHKKEINSVSEYLNKKI